MSTAERLPEPIVRTAIEWQMRLRADVDNAELHRQLQDWLRHDARHQLAWQRLQHMGGLFQANQLPDAAHTIPLLQRAEADLSRRRTLKLLGLGLAAGTATLLATHTPPTWHADLSTGIGESRLVGMGDGVEVLLNTGSALDVHGRELLLRSGEVLVDGAYWQARCRFAKCEGQQARVLLRERDGHSEIRVERGEVLVSAEFGQRRLRAGEGLGVSARDVTPLGKGPLDPFAWARGLLVVSDIRLADFLAEAGRYRQGWLGCDRAVADLHLSGVFRLDEPTVMLRNITHLLPVKIVERTHWWVRIVPVA
jgi:ferric-dicitrate binding protein FerR (iron transport regulator)